MKGLVEIQAENDAAAARAEAKRKAPARRLTKKERADLMHLHDHVRWLVRDLPVLGARFERSLRLLHAISSGERAA